MYRQVFTDGRALPVDPNPSWQGYSSAMWSGDTLVIDTIGFRDDVWLDWAGSMITSAGRLRERIRRPDFGHLDIEVTVDDPKAYTRPWSVTLRQQFAADTELIDGDVPKGEVRKTTEVTLTPAAPLPCAFRPDGAEGSAPDRRCRTVTVGDRGRFGGHVRSDALQQRAEPEVCGSSANRGCTSSASSSRGIGTGAPTMRTGYDVASFRQPQLNGGHALCTDYETRQGVEVWDDDLGPALDSHPGGEPIVAARLWSSEKLTTTWPSDVN